MDKSNYDKIKEDINIKMNRIYIVNNYIEFLHFKSIMFEKIAEKYYNLGAIVYSNYGEKKNQLSNELQEIVDIFKECVKNYEKTENQKTKMEEYSSTLEKVTAHRNILLGKEHLIEGKYNEALEFFKKVNYNNSNMIEEKNKGIYLCHEKMAEKEEEKQNYEEAIKHYKFIDNYFKIYELNIKINENNIIECLKAKDFNKTFDYFQNIFDLLNKAKNRDFIEFKFSKIFITFIDLIIKLAIISYQKNTLKNYIQILENLKSIISNEELSLKVIELLSELKMLESDNAYIYFEYIKKELNSYSSEIKQRFYLSLLIIKYLKEKPLDTLMILLRRDVKLSYLTLESAIIIKEYFSNQTNLNDLLLISKLLYKIIVNVGLFNRIENLNVIGKKILEINKIQNIENEINYDDVIEYLILTFQEIMINNTNLNKYDGPKKIICSVILKSNKKINCISRSLLFLSTKEIRLEKNIIDIIISQLIQNENDNLLQTLIIQCELEPKIIAGNLGSIYKILFSYQKLKLKNKDEKIEKIFNFLYSLPDDLISSNVSIQNLEKYITEMEINPLCFKLIRRIPIKKRSIKLTQKLSSFNNKKAKDNMKLSKEDIKNQYKLMSTINKEDLPQFENNLSDQFYFEKLMFYLKNQKYLLQHLDMVEICKHFSLSTKELFNLLIENEIKFNEKALINLLCGFYKNSENEIKETFAIFSKIIVYQEKFPFIIETNLKIEEFLHQKLYKNIKSFDLKLKEIFNDLSYLNGFANQHQKFVLYLLKLSDDNQRQEIFKKMLDFLIEKYFDIGSEIYKIILENISLNEFINIIPNIFSAKKISKEIKEETKKKLFIILKESEDKAYIINSFKYFIDFIIIPNKYLEYLISLLKNENSREIYKEIIFILGNYFSTKITKNKTFLNNIIEIVSEKQIYKYILNNIKSIDKNNEILYLYGCLNYVDFEDTLVDVKKVLKIPIQNIVTIIQSLNNKLDKHLIDENIAYLNNYYKFGDFSPKRDQILRKLFFNNKKNSINKIKLICC